MSLLQLLQAPRARRLMDVLIALPRLGVGARVTRASWAPYGDSFWDVTSVKPVDDTCADAKVRRCSAAGSLCSTRSHRCVWQLVRQAIPAGCLSEHSIPNTTGRLLYF